MGWPVAPPAVPAPEVTTSVCCEACKIVAARETMRNFGFSYAYWLCLDMGECLARQIAQHITDPGSGIAKADEIPVVAAGAGEPGQIPEPESSDEGAESGA